ncbi:MAG: hypothetical protein ACOYEG_14045, partial [Petrimonas sp.]
KILVITAIFLSSNLMIAQNQTLSLGYGVVSTDQTIFTMSRIFTSIVYKVFEESYNFKSSSYTGPLTLSYHHTLERNERFSFGGSLAYENAEFINTENGNDAFGYNAFTVAPEGKFKYLNPKNKFNMYAVLGLGITFFSYNNYERNETDVLRHINLQFTPLGFEYGGNVKGFLELGFGYKGIISGGIAFKF